MWIRIAFTLALIGASPVVLPMAVQNSDRDFALAASIAGDQQLHDAQMALQLSRMEPVRALARVLQKDHAEENAALAALVRAKGLALTHPAPSDSPTLSFSDAEFVAAQIQAHEDEIALYKSEAERGSDHEFRRFATLRLPVSQRHLKMLRALQTP